MSGSGSDGRLHLSSPEEFFPCKKVCEVALEATSQSTFERHVFAVPVPLVPLFRNLGVVAKDKYCLFPTTRKRIFSLPPLLQSLME